MASNVAYHDGKLYTVNVPFGSAEQWLNTGSLLPSYIQRGWVTQLGDVSQNNSGKSQTSSKAAFTPNQYTQQQLTGLGASPQWMMDAYTNKIGQIGGNANLPPFAVTQSGFPGQAGKPGLPSAPTGTTGGSNG